MHILIIKLSALGDVVHTLPALTTLRRHLPHAEISWLIEDVSSDLITAHPALNHVVVLPRRRWLELRHERRWVAAARLWAGFTREFRRSRFDLAIDFQGLAKSALWIALARSGRKAGFDRGLQRNEGAWLALNERVPAPSPDLHALDRGLHLIESIGFPRLPLQYGLPQTPDAGAEATRLLSAEGIRPDAPFVAINPMTRWATKDWEPGQFAAVAERIRDGGISLVFTGGPNDRKRLDEVASHMKGPMTRVDGRTSLQSLAALFRRARVLLSTDTGPMHLAAAVGTPVVALFGPTAPWRTGPYGEGHVVLRMGIECSPCFKRVCETTRYEKRACMLRLGVDEVVTAVLKVYNRPA